MKTSTFRKMTALVLSIMLVLSMCMTGISVSAAEGTKTVYFQVSTNWQEANARFAAYTWADGSDGTFTSMTKVEEGIYSANVSNNCPNIIFVRINPETTNNDWNNVWNQTADLTIPTDKNCFNINAGEWDGANGTWSVYGNPNPTAPTTTQPVTNPIITSSTIFFAPSTNWKEANARFAMYMWNDYGEKFVSMTKNTDSLYTAELAEGYTNIIFVRMDPSKSENSWDYKWNQTADLTVPQGKNYFTLNQGEWDGAQGTWSVHTVPTKPTTQPTVPTTEPTEPTTKPTVPTTEPTEPTTMPTAPTTEPTEPTTQPTQPASDFTYTVLEDGRIEITGYTGNASVLTIPATIDGYEVFGIGDKAFKGNTNLTSVTLEEGIIYVGYCTFADCTNLTKFKTGESTISFYQYSLSNTGLTELPELSSELTYYNAGMFENCNKLTNITIPDNITVLANSAFSKCSNLVNVNFSKNIYDIDDSTFANCTSLKEAILPESLRYAGMSVFLNCSSLKKVVFPESFKSMDNYMFQNCTSLETVTLHCLMESIGYGAFIGCTSLKSIEIPSKVSSIGYRAFENCNNLTIYGYTNTTAESYATQNNINFVALEPNFVYTVLEDGTAEIKTYNGTTKNTGLIIPSEIDGYTVTSIGSRAFASSYLAEVIMPDTITNISNDAFYCCYELTRAVLSKNLKTIGDFAFNYCTKLENVTLPEGLTYIGDNAFCGCYEFTTVTIPSTVTTTGYQPFVFCENLKEVIFAEGINLKTIRFSSFSACTSLEEIALPYGVETIEYQAFNGCTNLKSITIPASVTTIESKYDTSILGECPNVTVYGYSGTVAEEYANTHNIPFVALNPSNLYEYEVLDDGTIKVTDYLGEGDTLVIPSTIDGYQVSEFDGNKFWKYDRSNCKKLVLCDGIKKIGAYACSGWSNLEEVQLADSIQYIYENAFHECKNLTIINFPANLEYIGEFAFRFCTNLKTIELTGGKLTCVDYGAFEDCSLLNTVTIKGDNAEIDSYAFCNCTRLIKLNLSGIKKISTSAFDNVFITEVVLPEGLETIKDYAFGYCNFLTKVVIPKSVTTIEYGAFNGRAVIYGYTGSAAEAYANKRGFTFIPLDGGANITGDIDLTLLKTDENIYSADIELKAGTYKFNVDHAGAVLGFNTTCTDAGVINYSGGFKAQTTLVATGGRYTFTFNTSTKLLTIKHKSFDDIVELVGGINAELVRPNKNTTVFTGTVKLSAGTYYFNVYEGGQIFGLNYSFEDVIYDHAFLWSTPTGFTATGGTYSIRYDSATNKLKIMHAPAGLGDVTIFGDISLPLANQGNGVYSAQTILDAGSYEIRVDALGKIFGNGAKFTDTINVEFKTDWKAAATLTVTEKMKFTFIFDTNTNKFKVFSAPIDTTKVKVAFDDIDALELTSVDGVTYTAKTTLEAGTYTFRMDEFGTPMGGKYTFTDNNSNMVYNATYASATTMTATGGTYTFSFNTTTNALKVTKG